MIPDFNASARTNLKLELAWHSFKVNTRNFNAGIETSLIVSVNYCSSISDVRSD